MIHRAEMMMWMMGCTIGTDWIVIMMPITVIPINKRIYTIVWSPPMRIISPVIW
jgi:ABC-type cobalamin transport system permease subunit